MEIAIVRNLPIESTELNALRTAAWEAVGDQDWEPILARSLGWVGATDGGRLVAFVNIAWDGGVPAFLLDTTVHPDYQRRALGRALVREAAPMARERGAEWLQRRLRGRAGRVLSRMWISPDSDQFDRSDSAVASRARKCGAVIGARHHSCRGARGHGASRHKRGDAGGGE